MRSLYQFRLQTEGLDHSLQADSHVGRGDFAGVDDPPELFADHELRPAARERLVAEFPTPGVHFDWDSKALDWLAGWVIRFLEVRR